MLTTQTNMPKCNICKTPTHRIFDTKILGKYPANYFRCSNCEFIQTDTPYWLEEAYKNPINNSDTGLMARNIDLSRLTSIVIFFWLNKKGIFLDFAGGYGVLTRLMRDIGFDFYWRDKYTDNLFSKGFEYQPDTKDKFEMITAFEFLEHAVDPLKELDEITSMTDTFLFSTVLTPRDTLPQEDWFYFGVTHGQHISFFSKKTLEYLANKYGMYLHTNNKNIHLLTRKKLPFLSISLIQKLKRFGANKIINRNMRSKTVSDHNKIKNDA